MVAGRPKKTIDLKRVNKLLRAGCSGMEIAARLGIHHDTLYNSFKEKTGQNFSDYSAIYYGHGNAEIREKQFDKALAGKGDNQLLILLGKHRLGQWDKQDTKGSLEEFIDKFRSALREINAMPGDAESPKSLLEDEQPLSHQECAGEKADIPLQLDAKTAVGEPPLL